MKENYLIDGFNFLHSIKQIKSNSVPRNPKDMVHALEAYAAETGHAVAVVFDGTSFEEELASQGQIDLHFSSPQETADAVIERLMMQVKPREALEWVLVSKDHALRDMAIGFGLRTWDPLRFFSQMTKASSETIESQKKTQEPFNRPFEGLP